MRVQKKWLVWLAIATWSLICILGAHPAVAQVDHHSTLKTASYGWRPFIYEEESGGTKSVNGLDTRLANLAFSNIGYSVLYEGETSWNKLLDDLKKGKKDIIISASKRPEREAFGYYSKEFRRSVNVLFVPQGASEQYSLKNAADVLKMFHEKSFRLGVVDGYSYGQKEIDAYIKDSDNESKIVKAETDAELFNLLARKQVDGFLIDQIVGADISYKQQFQDIAEEYPLRISELPYYILFSKKSKQVTPELVEQFNASITKLKDNGQYNKLVQQYLFPVLLGFTTGQKWYFFVELTGVISFAVSGLVMANREGYDLFGALVLAALPGVGGGVLRDMIAGRTTLGLMKAPTYMMAVIITVLVGYVLIQLIGFWNDKIRKNTSQVQSNTPSLSAKTFNAVIELLDTLGLSTLSIIGVIVALETQSSPLWLWGPIFAAITSAGGGIIRDMVRADPNNPSLKGSFYPIIAIIWGFIFSMFIIWYSSQLNYYPDEIFKAVMVIIAGSFVTRVIAIFLRLKMPLFSYQPSQSKRDDARFQVPAYETGETGSEVRE
ncbi:MAG: transporter substrate-binding domain-containing protein [Timaviella obliquedivisa GSE-PSE-MK23-08B]|jgi:polar amino acid transport system substrate-binding protein|nr:transporter substrate-binding domain-containing protein [Timaviella obliquedivisa GSE-PSE-MK23-08B]